MTKRASPFRKFDMVTALINNQLYNLTGDTVKSDGFSLNTFALVNGNEVLLVDGILPQAFQSIHDFKNEHPEWKLVGCILTHRHIPRLAEQQGISEFVKLFGNIPLILPKSESENDDAQNNLPSNLRYVDPSDSKEIQSFGIQVSVLPGHTSAHPLYLWKKFEILIGGDCLVGPADKNPKFSRPPKMFSWDDNILKENWKKTFEQGLKGIANICPLHGSVVLGKNSRELKEMMNPLAK